MRCSWSSFLVILRRERRGSSGFLTHNLLWEWGWERGVEEEKTVYWGEWILLLLFYPLTKAAHYSSRPFCFSTHFASPSPHLSLFPWFSFRRKFWEPLDKKEPQLLKNQWGWTPQDQQHRMNKNVSTVNVRVKRQMKPWWTSSQKHIQLVWVVAFKKLRSKKTKVGNRCKSVHIPIRWSHLVKEGRAVGDVGDDKWKVPQKMSKNLVQETPGLIAIWKHISRSICWDVHRPPWPNNFWNKGFSI